MICKKMTSVVFMAIFTFLSVLSVQASTFSEYWKQDADGQWFVERPDGERVRNAWLCDDAVSGNGRNVWYLMDGDGRMVAIPFVRDGTGSIYSIETEHNGYFGMLRHETGNYGGVHLVLSDRHDGTFASILNYDELGDVFSENGVADLSYINAADCVYTSSFVNATVPASDEAEAVTGGTGSSEKISGGKAMACDVDEDLCAAYFIQYLNEYRESIGRDALAVSEEQMEYACDRAMRESVSHEGNVAAYEICSTHGVLPSEYGAKSVEEAVAENALRGFRASPAHNSVLRLKTIRTVGAGFHIVEDKGNGTFNFYYCEANFEK